MMPFSLKLSTVSLTLASKGVKLIPKLLALSWDILYNGCKGLSSSLLPKMKDKIDSSSTFVMCKNNYYGWQKQILKRKIYLTKENY